MQSIMYNHNRTQFCPTMDQSEGWSAIVVLTLARTTSQSWANVGKQHWLGWANIGLSWKCYLDSE